jgi:hypothetical protein
LSGLSTQDNCRRWQDWMVGEDRCRARVVQHLELVCQSGPVSSIGPAPDGVSDQKSRPIRAPIAPHLLQTQSEGKTGIRNPCRSVHSAAH